MFLARGGANLFDRAFSCVCSLLGLISSTVNESDVFVSFLGAQKGDHGKAHKTGELAGGYACICARMRVDMRMYARICAALLPPPLQ